MTDLERRLMYRRGFGDGAKCSAIKHPMNADYTQGWHQGRVAAREAMKGFCGREGLRQELVLRTRS